MDDIDPQQLAHFQRYWESAASGITSKCDRYYGDLYSIRHGFAQMGLDLDEDSTYELLAPGLTKAEFDQVYLKNQVLSVLDQYHQAQQISGRQYVNEYAGHHYYGLQQLIGHSLPDLERELARQGGLPDISPVMEREIDFIMDLYKTGALQDDLERTAYEAACNSFRNAISYAGYLKEKEARGESYYRESREGLSYADNALELADAARAYYKPGGIPAAYGSFGGWDKDKGTVHFSRDAIKDLRQFFLVKELGWKFKEAKAFQDKGHFVLDASGSGHGMMVIPMQHILLKLQEYGRDIHDPQTFAEIGTDIDTFRACYSRERAEVLKNDKYKLLKPEINL